MESSSRAALYGGVDFWDSGGWRKPSATRYRRRKRAVAGGTSAGHGNGVVWRRGAVIARGGRRRSRDAMVVCPDATLGAYCGFGDGGDARRVSAGLRRRGAASGSISLAAQASPQSACVV